MGLAQHLANLESELAGWREELVKLSTRIRGREVEIAAVRANLELSSSLADLPRTEAILAVLMRAEGTLTPSDILKALSAAERDDDLRAVTATLDYLVKRGRIQRPNRGRYLAT